MIFWKTVEREYTSKVYEDVICPKCNHKGSSYFKYYRNVFKVYAIPVVPTLTYNSFECGACGSVTRKKDFDHRARLRNKEFKSSLPHPLWSYSLVLVFGVIAIIAPIYRAFERDQNEARIKSPKIGDKYVFKTDVNEYTLYKSIAISDSGTVFFINNYNINKVRSIGWLDEDTCYYKDSVYTYSENDMLKFLESGELYDIYRVDEVLPKRAIQ